MFGFSCECLMPVDRPHCRSKSSVIFVIPSRWVHVFSHRFGPRMMCRFLQKLNYFLINEKKKINQTKDFSAYGVIHIKRIDETLVSIDNYKQTI